MKSKNKVLAITLLIFAGAFLTSTFDFPNFFDFVPGIPQTDFRLGLDLQGGAQLIYNADVSDIGANDPADAVEGVRDVIERRVNALGVAEPIVQTNRSGDDWRVTVELAGIDDVDAAIAMIGETPLLEFKEPMPFTPDTEPEEESDAAGQEIKQRAQTVLDEVLADPSRFEELAREHSEDHATAPASGDLGYVTRGQLVPEFETVIFDELEAGQIHPELVQTPFGFHIIKKTDTRSGQNELGEPEGSLNQVRSSHILFTTAPDDTGINWQNTGLTGEYLSSASVLFDNLTGAAQVGVDFNNDGAELFKSITRRNIGQQVGIFLDGELISAPTVQEEISGGHAVISGNFTIDEAKTLTRRLNAGALPVPIELISQQRVGASLGETSVNKSLEAAMLGLALVLAFMLLYYRLPGLVAGLSLAIYGLIMLALFKLIPVTLTLSGIAGFILSLGMAVDANVLVFERLKEELKLNKSVAGSIKDAFARAWPAIFDGNLSTLLTCLILMSFSTSLVKGFAITLAIGIIVSVFSALVVTRYLLYLFSFWSKAPSWLYGVKINQAADQLHD